MLRLQFSIHSKSDRSQVSISKMARKNAKSLAFENKIHGVLSKFVLSVRFNERRAHQFRLNKFRQCCKSCLNIKVSCSTTRKKKYEKWTQNAKKLFCVPTHWKNCAGLNFPISLIIRMIEKSFIVSFSGYLASRRINEQKMDFFWFLWTKSMVVVFSHHEM